MDKGTKISFERLFYHDIYLIYKKSLKKILKSNFINQQYLILIWYSKKWS